MLTQVECEHRRMIPLQPHVPKKQDSHMAVAFDICKLRFCSVVTLNCKEKWKHIKTCTVS